MKKINEVIPNNFVVLKVYNCCWFSLDYSAFTAEYHRHVHVWVMEIKINTDDNDDNDNDNDDDE